MVAAPQPAPLPVPRRRLILAACAVSSLIAALDTAQLNVALPAIAADLEAPIASLQWISLGSTITLVALAPISGSLGDQLGRGRLFLWGFLTFLAGALLSALAWSVPVLALFRVLSGAGAAMLYANSTALVAWLFPPEERARAYGILSSAVSVGVVVAPVVSGLVTAWFSWRGIFVVTGSVALLGFLIGRAGVPAPGRMGRASLDLPGVLLFVAGTVSGLTGLSNAARAPWSSPAVTGLLLLAPVLLLLFARRQSRNDSPLLPPRIFEAGGVVPGLLIIVLIFSSGMIGGFLNPFVMRNGLGYPSDLIGLVSSASPVAMLLFSSLAAQVADRWGKRLFVAAGALAMAGGHLLLWGLELDWRPAEFALRSLLGGVAWGLFLGPCTALVMRSVPEHLTGVAGGLVSLARNGGFALGVPLATVAFSLGEAGLGGGAGLLAGYRTALLLGSGLGLAGLLLSLHPRLGDRGRDLPPVRAD